MINFCPECGFKLDEEYRFCPNCGIKLEQIKNETNKSSSGLSSPGKVQNVKKTGVAAPEASPAKLSLRALLAIISIIVGLVVITLFASGVFDTPKLSSANQAPQVTDNQNSGVDLSKMQDIKDLEDKVAANPKDNQMLLQLAHLKNDAGLYDQAITNYKQYLKTNSSDADARVDMGVCYFSLKNYDEAIAEMKEALTYKPEHQIAHMNLGIVYMASGKMDEAKKWFQKAIDLGPENEIGRKAKELLESHK